MVSERISGAERLPRQLLQETFTAILVGLEASCAHLRTHGCMCARARTELAFAPDSQHRAAFEQGERMNFVAREMILRAEDQAWKTLKMIRDMERVG